MTDFTMDIGQFLEEKLKTYDKVLLISDNVLNNCNDKLFSKINICKKILFIVTENMEISNKNIEILLISKKQAKEIEKLYCTYDFSDDFALIKENAMYSSLFNYRNNGMLNEEEVWQLLLN